MADYFSLASKSQMHQPGMWKWLLKPRGPDCVIFCGVHTPSLAQSTSVDSITMGAETAAAGWVMPSLNSSLLLTPGFWAQKAAKSLEESN